MREPERRGPLFLSFALLTILGLAVIKLALSPEVPVLFIVLLLTFWARLRGFSWQDVQDGIKEGIALAHLGYRPIPIFNGTNPSIGVSSTTNNAMIEPLLVWGALELEKIVLEENVPPVFLLDRNRLNRYKIDPSIFDNSWDIYPQDIPSPDYFLQNGITKIVVRGNQLSRDLKKVLYPYQKKNIKILFTNGYEEAREIKIKKIKEKEL